MSSDRKRSHRQVTSDPNATGNLPQTLDGNGSNGNDKIEGSPSNRRRYASPPLTSIRPLPTTAPTDPSSSLSPTAQTNKSLLPPASTSPSDTAKSDQVLRLSHAAGTSSHHSTSLPPPHTMRSHPMSSASDSSMSAASSVSASDAMDFSDEESVTPDVDQKGLFYMPTATSFAAREPAEFPSSTAQSALAAAATQAQSPSTNAPSSISTLPRATSTSRSMNASDELLPCEVPECYYYIRPAEYNDHVLLHHYDIVKRKKDREDAEMKHYMELLQKYENENSKAIQQQQQQQQQQHSQRHTSHHHAHAHAKKAHRDTSSSSAAAAAASSHPASSPHKRSSSPFVATQSVEGSLELVPCDFPGCGQAIAIKDYAKHQRSHETGLHPYTAEHGNRRYQPLQPSPTPAESPPIPRASSSSSPAAHSAAASSSFNSPPSFPSPLSRVRSIGSTFVPDRNFVSGIIEVLNSIFATRKHLEVYLCSPIQFFYRSKTDGGFGCGYKNIQTLCSALLQFPLYQEILFEGAVRDSKTPSFPLSATIKASPPTIAAASSASPSSTISLPPTPPTPPSPFPPMPPISSLQGYIDIAHQRGFDVVGGAQVGQLRNSKTWIGAVEAHALLCSYGTRSELIDFKSSCVGLMEYVYNYFHSRTKPVLDLAAASSIHNTTSSTRADAILNSKIDTHARVNANPAVVGSGENVTSASSSPPSTYTPPATPFVPPLYFQHQGHSRTIVGIVLNQRTHRFRLLVLDPDVAGGGDQLLANLKSSNPQSALKSLYRGEDALKAKEYQMVMISSFGVMTSAEQQRSKRPFSTVISAIDEPRSGHGTGRSSASSSTAPTSGSASTPSTVRFLPPGTPQVTDVHERGAGAGAGSTNPVRGGTGWKMERREVDGAFRASHDSHDQHSSQHHHHSANSEQTWLSMPAATRGTSDTSIQSNPVYRESHFVPVIPPSRQHLLPLLPHITNSPRDDSHVPTPSPCPPTNFHHTSASVSPPTTNPSASLSSGDRSGSGSKSTSRSRAASCSRIPAASRLLQLSLGKKDAV